MCWFCVGFLFCGKVLDFFSSLAIILLRKRELVALLCVVAVCSLSLPHGAMGWAISKPSEHPFVRHRQTAQTQIRHLDQVSDQGLQCLLTECSIEI